MEQAHPEAAAYIASVRERWAAIEKEAAGLAAASPDSMLPFLDDVLSQSSRRRQVIVVCLSLASLLTSSGIARVSEMTVLQIKLLLESNHFFYVAMHFLLFFFSVAFCISAHRDLMHRSLKLRRPEHEMAQTFDKWCQLIVRENLLFRDVQTLTSVRLDARSTTLLRNKEKREAMRAKHAKLETAVNIDQRRLHMETEWELAKQLQTEIDLQCSSDGVEALNKLMGEMAESTTVRSFTETATAATRGRPWRRAEIAIEIFAPLLVAALAILVFALYYWRLLS